MDERCETCRTCKYFWGNRTYNDRGTCRLHGPGEFRNHESHMPPTRWPLVLGNEWCGDHKPVEQSDGE